MKDFWKDLNRNKNKLSKQQYKTLKGQAIKGDYSTARKGLNNAMYRRCG